LGGDLNFSLGEVESWGEKARPDPLSNFFSHMIAGRGLVDLVPPKITPTWRNKRLKEYIAKRLDCFPLVKVYFGFYPHV
jgi:hypothetical protein